jgi:hypothetical protein
MEKKTEGKSDSVSKMFLKSMDLILKTFQLYDPNIPLLN